MAKVILFAFLLATNVAFGQKYTADFLNIGIGARALALGGAYSAIANDASAVYWNPAGLAQLASPEMSLMHSSQFSDLLQANFVNFIFPTKSGRAFGISYFRVGVEDIPMATQLDEFHRPIIEKYFQDLEHAIFLSFASKVKKNLFIGGNLKTLYQQVADHSALGFGFDLGALYQFSPKFSVGACLQDATGTYLFWDTGSREMRNPNILVSVSLADKVPFLTGKIRAAIGQTIRFEGRSPENLYSIGNVAGVDLNAGLEYEIFQTISLRIGKERNHLTAGAGMKFSFFSVDYAFVSYDLGNAHRISGNIFF
ncbi:MAG: UPF0164 family protein [Calditrichaeota bacterium]|nr:UPF0164 family protein [Calditrichota bacterium]